MAFKIQLRRGTAAQWTAANPILAAGEVGIVTDEDTLKVGDGTTAWNSLPYSNMLIAPDSITTDKIADGAITQAKLDAGIELGVEDGAVTTAKLADGAVTTAKLAKEPIYLNGQNISANYSIPSGYNGLSAGPITIDSGVTVTIPAGSSWSIV